MDAAADRAELDPERGRDLLVGQSLDVTQNDGGAELGRERVECDCDVRLQMRIVDRLATGTALAAQPFGRLVGEPSNLMRCRPRAMSRNRLVVMRCSQPSNVPGV